MDNSGIFDSGTGRFGVGGGRKTSRMGGALGAALSAALREMAMNPQCENYAETPQREPDAVLEVDSSGLFEMLFGQKPEPKKELCPFAFQFELEAVSYIYSTLIELSSEAANSGDLLQSFHAYKAAGLVAQIGQAVLQIHDKTPDAIDFEFFTKMHRTMSLAYPELRCAKFGGGDNEPEPEPTAAANDISEGFTVFKSEDGTVSFDDDAVARAEAEGMPATYRGETISPQRFG